MVDDLMNASSDDAPAQAGHNLGDVKKIISECAGAMNIIIGKRQDLNEEAGDIRERLKEASASIPAFMDALKTYNMEPDARGAYNDARRVAYEAMGIGGQADFLAPMQGEVDAAQPGVKGQAGDFEEDTERVPPEGAPEEAAAPA